MIASWLDSGARELEASLASPAVQDAATIQRLQAENLPKLSATAERLYRRWLRGLKSRGPAP